MPVHLKGQHLPQVLAGGERQIDGPAQHLLGGQEHGDLRALDIDAAHQPADGTPRARQFGAIDAAELAPFAALGMAQPGAVAIDLHGQHFVGRPEQIAQAHWHASRQFLEPPGQQARGQRGEAEGGHGLTVMFRTERGFKS